MAKLIPAAFRSSTYKAQERFYANYWETRRVLSEKWHIKLEDNMYRLFLENHIIKRREERERKNQAHLRFLERKVKKLKK